ncbi:MAG: hypothetical protein WBW55_05445 [Desulfobaccales bacterium]
MTQPNNETIEKAITDVQRAYGELHARFLAKLKEAEEIKDHLAKLEAFMASAKALLSIGGESQIGADNARAVSLKPSSFVPPASLIEKPLLRGGVEILQEAGRPMHLSEIVDEFRKRRWKLSEKNGKEVLRYSFRKHIGTIFVRTKTGQYALKEQSGQTRPPLIRRPYPKVETGAPD